MIAIEKLKAVRTIVTHENCADGVASAILLHDALPEARIVFAQYGTRALAELAAEPGILFCDFSPPADRVQEFVEAGSVVLDHHKSARAVVEAFGEDGVFADEQEEPGVCGAVLAYRHVWLPVMRLVYAEHPSYGSASHFATTAGVRDTWHRSSPMWDQACAQAEALRFWPAVRLLATPSPFGSNYEPFASMLSIGDVLVEKHLAEVKRAVDRAWRATTSNGTRLLIFEGLRLTSDAAELVGDAADLIIGFGYETEDVSAGRAGRCIFSTRSHTGYHCASLAKYHGGGGHTAAAGFSFQFIPGDPQAGMEDPYTEAVRLVEAFEMDAR